MGYRSEVGIKCESKAYDMFMDVIKEHDWLPDTVYKNGCGEYTLSWTWIKWYESYDEVQAIVNLMNELDDKHEYENNDCLGYHFIRIGEDYEDVEIRCNNYNLEFYITREIDYDGEVIEVA